MDVKKSFAKPTEKTFARRTEADIGGKEEEKTFYIRQLLRISNLWWHSMTQTKIIPMVNKNLFSNYYLDNRVKTIPEWKKNDHIVAFSEIKKLYEEERKSFENFNEAQLIKHFLDPIFKILLFESEVEEAVGGEFPDYAFFRDKNSRDEAHKNKGTISFYTNALAIGEVKKWVTELDGKPIHQLRNYLDVTEKKWGILTNGRKWRLFCKEKKRDEYYEVDLPSLLDNNDVEGFKYFFYFFRRDAFLFPDSFLEGVLRESEVHAKTIGNNLKENVYKAMKKIAEGFFGRPQNNLDRNDEAARERVQKNTMLLLYRLLFLLYAEDRNLLDLTNTKYLNNHSFRRIKKEVEEKRGRIEQGYDYSGTTIWDRLKSLFELINVGSEAIGEKEFHVPAYNGGLFDTKKNPELDEKWKIGDKYLAEAIHLLTWSDVNGAGGFVDYSELEIRHLGSIYEGLLEYKLKVAESDIVTKENEWVSLEKYNEGRKQKKAFEEFDEFSHARKGELYLATDKGERKATGSYYTPDYIVNYIVRNTIGAVVDEKWKETQEKNKRFIDATLSVKVLDPAMGSGHFLVGAVDFLAEKLLNAAQKDIEAWRLAEEAQYSDLDWARREVVAHCIYGVDLNPMAVELAKVSLWLKTISKDKPLSFLDHRLKCGNSLIGAKLLDVAWYPSELLSGKEKKDAEKRKKEREQGQQTFEIPFIEGVADLIAEIDKETDETITGILHKKEIFDKLTESNEYKRLKTICDLYTGLFFDAKPTENEQQRWGGYISSFFDPKNEEWRDKPKWGWPKKGLEIASDKKFFHWELEFPEIFFEEGKIKENPGFDAVVGNPPYGLLDTTCAGRYYTTQGNQNAYVAFMQLSLDLGRIGGSSSLIVPTTWLTGDNFRNLREYILKTCKVKVVVKLPYDIFREAYIDTAVYLNNKLRAYLPDSKPVIHETLVHEFTPREKVQEKLEKHSEFEKISSDVWYSDRALRFLLNKKVATILSKVSDKSTSIALDMISHSNRGTLPPKKFVEIKVSNRDSKILPWFDGQIYRYEIIDNPPYKLVDLDEIRETKDVDVFQGERIITRQLVSRQFRFQSAITRDRFAHKKNLYVIYNITDKNYGNWYLLSLLNSKLFSYAIIWSLLGTQRDDYPAISLEDYRNFPIRLIHFTTLAADRTRLVEWAKKLYATPDFASLLKLVDECLPRDVNGNFISEKEKSDVVHDILAFLAEQMIEMNKQKQFEIRGFTDWLEGYCKVKIDELTSRTKLQAYYKCDWNEIKDVLAKNKKKIAELDITRREPLEKINDEYDISIKKLRPLLQKIESTDKLIDQIVYKLYGLTEEEIKIVEGSIGKK